MDFRKILNNYNEHIRNINYMYLEDMLNKPKIEKKIDEIINKVKKESTGIIISYIKHNNVQNINNIIRSNTMKYLILNNKNNFDLVTSNLSENDYNSDVNSDSGTESESEVLNNTFYDKCTCKLCTSLNEINNKWIEWIPNRYEQYICKMKIDNLTIDQ